MKLTLLTDNNTLIDRYFIGEPGFSAYIQDENVSIIFDLGYSDVFLRNAQKMHIDLSTLDFIAFSHGHCDHTWGIVPLMQYYAEREFEKMPRSHPTIVGHPKTFTSVSADGYSELGSIVSEAKLEKFFTLHLDDHPYRLTDRLLFLGQIPRKTDFEGNRAFGKKDGETDSDYVAEDSALVYTSSRGLVIITGCSHSGICNIIEYAQFVTNESRIVDIIGGFHLLDPDEKQMTGTLNYLKTRQIECMHPCHCTDLQSKIRLAAAVPVKEAGVGLELEYY
jgi:7,8-dihydropterin-6-yl-methyl-4-(beta-D-ribofuranosyl)aminobenzene 5'-phosphate synthase